ncbi:ATP-dependent Clp protease adaptor protein ClpS [Ectocarpus siliculosus]|uniref:ATP-dependent Clp protease adaptor protein ClpS n=1 Tax=Ectocarpus siliculosus TaxID=2880 RepID=D8LE99_ECTSI|nr:ATP-dependent Clp protease adaptor protein ClpS [Ectocarpus siliculosus]|eukprot:CBN74180.1 ATP-dependent Clp protease adaptor protein ClpS [Ectocarpus siliculosus]
MFRPLQVLILALVASASTAFVVPAWTAMRPAAASGRPISALNMAAGVAMPEIKTAGPSIGVLDKKEVSFETSIRPEDKYKVLLFNDNGNTREYVSRSLVQVVGLSEATAFHIMQQANDNGMAQVGIWHQEMADAYSTSLKERGLIAETHPAE